MNLKEYFEFSKKELNGLIVLCVLLVLIILTPELYLQLKSEDKDLQDTSFRAEVAEFLASAVNEDEANEKAYGRRKWASDTRKKNVRYFLFNPNNLPESKWLDLGLSAKQVKVIKNYEAKGGRFYRKEDLKKIYSLRSEDYDRLEPYIAIPNSYRTKPLFRKFEKRLSEREKSIININTADSAELETLRGIGPAFASRIIKYRSRLGGFWKKEQLLEVYGLDSIKYKGFEDRIMVEPGAVLKTNVNSASFEDLKRFPYLSYKQINAIVQYRKQHGNYGSPTDLKKVLLLNDEVIAKIAPYISF
ncbi:helix-hairpin-helix domain-containing protein [Desertivirga brevis]|uniref:helix-hairpin-helix domain-containing protein n=1 Tax=Desertivirga brevis TaxID=2810310 RepID=UPI001A97345E|nr:helix-hairpin-helix domain-containing protein [Pedobacter sp. SYSU D00873]